MDEGDESYFELLGTALVETNNEEGPKKWRVIAFTFDLPLIGYGPNLEGALDKATSQIKFKKVEKPQK